MLVVGTTVRMICVHDPSLKRANLSALEMSVTHIVKRCTSDLFTYFELLL